MIKEEINTDLVYLTIPKEYVCIYKQLMLKLSDYGVDMLKDCKASCSEKNRNIIDCFNTFNSAIAAKNTGNDKLAKTLIKYIVGTLKLKGYVPEPQPEPTIPYWYVGQLSTTASDFKTLSDTELINNATKINIDVKQHDEVLNEWCWYAIIPEGYSPESAQFSSGGLTTVFTEDQIVTRSGFTIDHDDITIDSIKYSVYCYRNIGLRGSNVNSSFKIK